MLGDRNKTERDQEARLLEYVFEKVGMALEAEVDKLSLVQLEKGYRESAAALQVRLAAGEPISAYRDGVDSHILAKIREAQEPLQSPTRWMLCWHVERTARAKLNDLSSRLAEQTEHV